MKAHGFDMRGEFKGDRVPTLPSWTSDDEGREIYVEDEDKRYYGNNSEWQDYSIVESATETDSYLESISFENKLVDNGRFGGTDAGLSLYLSDVNDPFTNSSFFALTINSGNATEAGKFIHNNDDYGGSSGSMTQTTIDLLETMSIRSTNRYGVEFRIADLAAGSGTSISDTFPGGTRYLMTTNGSMAYFGFGGYGTFCAWVRAVGGSIGFRASSYNYFSINGVEQELTNYDLTTGTGWVFLLASIRSYIGYNNGYPYIYGNDGSSLQVAIPAFFNGFVKNVYYEAPLVSNF